MYISALKLLVLVDLLVELFQMQKESRDNRGKLDALGPGGVGMMPGHTACHSSMEHQEGFPQVA